MASMIPAPKVACLIQIKIAVKPADRDAFLVLFKQIFDHVSAEPECAYFIIGEEEPGVFCWMEGWTKDKEWFESVCMLWPSKVQAHIFQVQLKRPYYEPYFKATQPLLIPSES
jgi:hypothetical protein